MRSASLAPLRSLLVSKRLAWANDQTFSGDRFYHLGLPRASIQRKPPPQCISAHLRGATGSSHRETDGKTVGLHRSAPCRNRFSGIQLSKNLFTQNSDGLSNQPRYAAIPKSQMWIEFVSFLNLEWPLKPATLT